MRIPPRPGLHLHRDRRALPSWRLRTPRRPGAPPSLRSRRKRGPGRGAKPRATGTQPSSPTPFVKARNGADCYCPVTSNSCYLYIANDTFGSSVEPALRFEGCSVRWLLDALSCRAVLEELRKGGLAGIVIPPCIPQTDQLRSYLVEALLFVPQHHADAVEERLDHVAPEEARGQEAVPAPHGL